MAIMTKITITMPVMITINITALMLIIHDSLDDKDHDDDDAES